MYNLEIQENSFLHNMLLRIAQGEDIRKLKVHPLWCTFLDRLDVELRDKLNSWGKECKDALLREDLLVDTNRNQIKWNPDEDGYLNKGDVIYITASSNETQTFTVRENVKIGDTRLLIEPVNIKYIFLEGDHICFQDQEKSINVIESGTVYRRYDNNITGIYINVDVPLPDPDSMSLDALVKSHIFLKNGQRLVIKRNTVQGMDYGYDIDKTNNRIVLGIAGTEYDTYELFLKNPHLYA